MPPLRLVLVEDSVVYRHGLATILERAGFRTVGHAYDIVGGLELIGRERPDCALIDIRLPPTQTNEGVELARAVRSAYPSVGVLLLSNYLDEEFALELVQGLRRGIGYLLKERLRDGAVLSDAVRRIVAREVVIDPAIIATLMNRRERRDTLANLTAAEYRVLGEMAQGRSNDGIAAALMISGRTVNAHIRAIIRKLNLHDADQLDRRVAAVLLWLGARGA